MGYCSIPFLKKRKYISNFPLKFSHSRLRPGGILESSLFSRLLDGNGHSHSHAHHGVISCADETHHLYVCGNRRRACELSVRVHAAHRVGHTVRSGTGSHVVGMQGAARTAAGGYGEVFLFPFSTHSFL